MTLKTSLNRRRFLGTTAAAAGLTLAAPTVLRADDDYPSRNISVYIPTAEGGGADRNFRAFASVWKDKLGTDFEPGFYPGASGRVGYELYMGKAEPEEHVGILRPKDVRHDCVVATDLTRGAEALHRRRGGIVGDRPGGEPVKQDSRPCSQQEGSHK